MVEGKKEKLEKCFRCQKKRPLTRHHIPPRRLINNIDWGIMKWDGEYYFTIPVCRECHNILDDETLSYDGLRKQYEWVIEKMGVSSPVKPRD